MEKWTSADFYGGRIPVQIEFDCTYEGALCDSCLEFSTLDRIIYNLLNNAARNANDHVVYFHILPMPRQETVENLRFVITNQVSAEHTARLTAAVPDLGQLFRSGFTTGGHGVGMSIVADFCMQAFGIFDGEKAKNDGTTARSGLAITLSLGSIGRSPGPDISSVAGTQRRRATPG